MQAGINTKCVNKRGLKIGSNHSLQATGMFQANLPEHVIQSRTGHYERVTEDERKEGVVTHF